MLENARAQNLKAAAINANRYNPDINCLMEDLANHYEAIVLPTRVRHHKDTANAKNSISGFTRK